MNSPLLMLLRRLLVAGLGAAAVAVAAAGQDGERERNAWPFWVRQDFGAEQRGVTAAGPFLFARATETGSTRGFRPFWVQQEDAAGNLTAGYFLYPLFSYRQTSDTYEWSLMELIRRRDRREGAPAPTSQFEPSRKFEVWPLWFSKTSLDPDESYRALFPVAGTLKHKFGFDRASWLAFPLYVQTEKRGIVTTSTPWPIVRRTSGAASGFGLWPLYEQRDKPGSWRQRTYLWPFGYSNTFLLPSDGGDSASGGVRREIGILPFYARHTAPGVVDESFLWPFFGYTDKAGAAPYHETRYFWPLLVQGRGADRHVNRWGPFYTHSVVKGYDKSWYLWPVVRHATWTDRGLALSKTQVLYFLYWSERQRSLRSPDKAAASLTHLWPLYSHWDNGAGRRQLQLLSPLEVFFPGNEKIRAAWSPFFALARHERSAPGETRTSLLWNAVTVRRSEARGEREFHLGPLFSTFRSAHTRRFAVGNGLLSFRREPASGWTFRVFDFPTNVTPATQPR